MTIDQIKHFIEVAELENLNQAAKALNISPSSLTRSIQIIEDTLGHQLFDRVNRKIFLNDKGRSFLVKAKKVLQDFHGLHDFTEKNDEIIGEISFGASPFLSDRLLPEICIQLQDENPKSKFYIQSQDTNSLPDAVLSGKLDVALLFGPLNVGDDLFKSEVFNGQMKVACSKKSILINKPFKKCVELMNKQKSAVHKPGKYAFSCENHPVFNKFGIKPQHKFYFDSDSAAIEILKRAGSWALLPDIVINSTKEIAEIKHPKEWDATYNVYLIWNRRFDQSLHKKLVQDKVLRAFK